MSHANTAEDLILGGWQMTGILGLRSGTPFSPFITVNQANTAFGGNLRPNRNGSGTVPDPNVDKWFDRTAFSLPALFTYGNSTRNILIGPGLTDFDFSLFKNNYVPKISETFNIQFRAELFNVLNHPNFAPPPTPSNTDIFTPTGATSGSVGVLTSTSTTSREIQFALKFMW